MFLWHSERSARFIELGYQQSLLARPAHAPLPSGTRVRLYHFGLCAVSWIDGIVESPIVLIRCAGRKTFVSTRATIHARIHLSAPLTAVLAIRFTGIEAVLRTAYFLRPHWAQDQRQ